MGVCVGIWIRRDKVLVCPTARNSSEQISAPGVTPLHTALARTCSVDLLPLSFQTDVEVSLLSDAGDAREKFSPPRACGSMTSVAETNACMLVAFACLLGRISACDSVRQCGPPVCVLPRLRVCVSVHGCMLKYAVFCGTLPPGKYYKVHPRQSSGRGRPVSATNARGTCPSDSHPARCIGS